MARPRKWGWHQLTSHWADQLVSWAPISPGSLVLDVGAGAGAITASLLASGARIIAIEMHPQRVATLRARFEHEGVVVVRADATALRLPRRPYHVVANPPFAATNALLRRLVQPGSRMLSATLVLQEQAARRWASLSAPAAPRWRQAYGVSLGPSVPRREFIPPPHVNARVLQIWRLSAPRHR